MHNQKVLFVCTFLALMVSNSVAIEIKPNSPTTTPGKEEKIRHACPLEGIDFPNFDLTYLKTSSWEECGTLCGLFYDCKFWSWNMHNSCWLKTSDQHMIHKDGFISGDRGCTTKTCPEGWLDSPEGCFHFATEVETKTWDEAVEYCQALGGYLAEVLNEESQRFLVAEATALGESTNWWLGATDQELEGQWVWVKNAVPVEFSAWYPGEPNDLGLDENCLHLFSRYGYQWNDSHCSESYLSKPLCQKRL